MGIRENIADHLKEYKTKRGLSVRQMACELKVGPGTIQNCLHMRGNPTLETLECLADQMGIPEEALFLPPDHLWPRQEDTLEFLRKVMKTLEEVG